MYADHGRASIAPEKLIRALLLQVLYSVRSERLLVEQLHYNLLFRWFVGLAIDEAASHHSSLPEYRDRRLITRWRRRSPRHELGREGGLLSDEHLSVDGTLIKAWASHKSFQPKDEPPADGGAGRNPEASWRGKPRSNDTHESTTDPEARLYRKSSTAEAILCYQGHVLIENRNGLVVNARASVASGFAERENALAMLAELPGTKPRTVGADKAYDTSDFVAAARKIEVTPHVAQHHGGPGGSAIDGRTTRHPGYESSQCIRKRIEESFGWAKTVGRVRQTVFRGLERVNMQFLLTMTANNLLRMRGLLAGATS